VSQFRDRIQLPVSPHCGQISCTVAKRIACYIPPSTPPNVAALPFRSLLAMALVLSFGAYVMKVWRA